MQFDFQTVNKTVEAYSGWTKPAETVLLNVHFKYEKKKRMKMKFLAPTSILVPS